MLDAAVSQSPTAAIEELQTFIRRERDSRQVKKALAVKLSYQGYGYEEIVAILDVSLGAVSNWKQAYEQSGLAGFKPNHKGRQSYLSASEREAVVQWLQSRETWNVDDLEYHLAEQYGVTYEAKSSYHELLSAAGFSWKKTSAANPKADAEAVAAKKSPSKLSWRAIARRARGGS